MERADKMSRKITLREKIAYELSFSLAERWERRKEAAAIWIARRLPKRVRLWVVVTTHAAVTQSSGDKHPDEISAFDLHKALSIN
jgi:ribosomal protein L16/L10AE